MAKSIPCRKEGSRENFPFPFTFPIPALTTGNPGLHCLSDPVGRKSTFEPLKGRYSPGNKKFPME